ncbi:hypothetical protein DKE41_012340 [Acinetobacter pittii]|nr:hypothetical protein DKE41_012340 [Acinetobacter pittii]
MIANHNEHNISEIKDYTSLSKCLDYALRHNKFMKKPMFTRCASIPLKTLLYKFTSHQRAGFCNQRKRCLNFFRCSSMSLFLCSN